MPSLPPLELLLILLADGLLCFPSLRCLAKFLAISAKDSPASTDMGLMLPVMVACRLGRGGAGERLRVDRSFEDAAVPAVAMTLQGSHFAASGLRDVAARLSPADERILL